MKLVILKILQFKFKEELVCVPAINSPKQYRFFKAILEKPRELRELMDIIGTNNPNSVKYALKKKGWIIHTDDIEFINRDGIPTTKGQYRLDNEYIPYALAAIEDYENGEVVI